LGCTYSGEDLEIGFNARFLNEMLSNIDAQEINIEMSAPNRAGIITPTISDDNQEDLLMLVMPVMLNN
jgi:DNA polymerase III subunit beta